MNKSQKSTSLQEQHELQEAKFQTLSLLFDKVIYKSYLHTLSDADIIPYNGGTKSVRWYQITKIVYEKGVFFTDKMAMLYASLHKVGGMVAIALHKRKGGHVELFIGTRDENGGSDISGEILEAGLKGILPGITLSDNYVPDMLQHFEADRTSISAVSGVGSLSDDKKENFIQGIENLINSTKSIPTFTAIILADKVSGQQAEVIRNAYENLYSEISPMAEMQLSFNEAESQGVNDTLTEGFNESVSTNVSRTISHGTSQSSTEGTSVTKNTGWTTGGSLIFVNAGRSGGKSYGQNQSVTSGTNKQESDQKGEGMQKGRHKDESHSTNSSTTAGQTMQFTRKNRHVQTCMDIIDRQIERMQKSISSGLWSVATYFITKDNTTAQKLAGIYRGTIIGDRSELETVSINLWPVGSDKVVTMLDYLRNQCHPSFLVGQGVSATAASLVDSRELAIHLSLPQKSVPGLLVREEQSFGRDVKSLEPMTEENSIPVGKVVHLGETYDNDEVRLSINGLSKHILVTGTTGSGKSNTLYLLIDLLMKRNMKMLVIEPAKGEYKEVFGNRPDVHVYGTNPRNSSLLTINPFCFPKAIDIYEHIDSLVEIFNACWPMYAAMPQVMKHSIMEAYKSCGWNLELSENKLGIYPSIEDVLDALKEYINSSDYSSDTKGDYKGSLQTRLQSLCEGLVGRMFRGNPIPDEQLFNENVIIDLSRVKSAETKSLLMGILVMKLNEFRQAENKGMNIPLRHITVIEEAHNLLKRTSTTQTAESSNVAGMAVEKIANSMAEMRTYGEGFLIADQSPSMLDLATIRNTNTKIVMTLPEREDRETAGRAVGLDDEQVVELSHLKTGEAIVYQTGWEEPVKTLIDYYKDAGTSPWNYKPEEVTQQTDKALGYVLDTLCKLYSRAMTPYVKHEMEKNIMNSQLSGSKKAQLLKHVSSVRVPSVDQCAAMMAIIVGTELCAQMQHATDIVTMNRRITQELQQLADLQNDVRINTYVNMYVRGCSQQAAQPFYQEWMEKTVKSVIK